MPVLRCREYSHCVVMPRIPDAKLQTRGPAGFASSPVCTAPTVPRRRTAGKHDEQPSDPKGLSLARDLPARCRAHTGGPAACHLPCRDSARCAAFASTAVPMRSTVPLRQGRARRADVKPTPGESGMHASRLRTAAIAGRTAISADQRRKVFDRSALRLVCYCRRKPRAPPPTHRNIR